MKVELQMEMVINANRWPLTVGVITNLDHE
jgi:hypothetical protein